jgi:hypothetical protein
MPKPKTAMDICFRGPVRRRHRTVARVVALDGQDDKVSTGHPEIRFEAIGAQQAAVRKILRGNNRANGAEQEGIAASAQLAGQNGRLDDEQRRRDGGEKTDGAQRISEEGAGEVNQERDERGLVNVSPLQVVGARHVVEFVAEISVAVIEVDVEEKLGEGDGPDQGHARRKTEQ